MTIQNSFVLNCKVGEQEEVSRSDVVVFVLRHLLVTF